MLETLENGGRLPPGRYDELVGDAAGADAAGEEAGTSGETGSGGGASLEQEARRWGWSPFKSPVPSG